MTSKVNGKTGILTPVDLKPVKILLQILDWIGLSSVLRPREQSTGYMGDGTTNTGHIDYVAWGNM